MDDGQLKQKILEVLNSYKGKLFVQNRQHKWENKTNNQIHNYFAQKDKEIVEE